MIVVANAGPLIALARIGHLGVLRSLYRQIHIPMMVQVEVVDTGHHRPGTTEINQADWIHTVGIQNNLAVQLIRERLDAGESEAIILALEINADLLLIDELRGRRIAEIHGLAYTGTVGILILAKRRGLIQAVTPLLDDLQNVGFWMNENLYQQARSLADEL